MITANNNNDNNKNERGNERMQKKKLKGKVVSDAKIVNLEKNILASL